MRHSLATTAVVVIALSSLSLDASTAGAREVPDTGSTTLQTVTSERCVEKVHAIAEAKGVPSDARICSATIVVTETAVAVATVDDVRLLAREVGLGESETTALVAAAAAGAVRYRNWTHAYWGGSLYEKHSGRTYWDGNRAWIAKYRGYTGRHTCHAEGSLAAGWAVKVISCSKPKSGPSADAAYRFDANAIFSGSPVTLSIGLHHSTSAKGVVSTWQVGG
jgi:hypothetical protein